MKCLECGAATEVLSTRTWETYVYRRRKCFNGHRFSTEERQQTAHTSGADGVVAFHPPRPQEVSETTKTYYA
jgi:hypothetical protein